MLSPAERARAERFVREADRWRFVISHGALRSILGDYLGLPAAALVFGSLGSGKPFLVSAPEVHFNLSHSAEFAVVAVARTPVGIDIEQIHPFEDESDIASRSFSTAECDALKSLTEAERLSAFFRCWTRKEAYVKARGDGLSIPLDSFSVSLTGRLTGVTSLRFRARGDRPMEIGRGLSRAGLRWHSGLERKLAPSFRPGLEHGRNRTGPTLAPSCGILRVMEVNFLV